ncbi:glycosyltransferase involved in cell wall biosynthesis [Rhodopseudomonas julia]|uniref:Glycosyltransferase involved in cell wall biosynthesis n=1 Tax=Rhodopseudomonas julia TaxID=200617 RepID=A0ABU0C2A7_9BRAD|nr:glycosyltransferase [Rhodopseudomonas julia]MDQ0324644.1 glycosyltransferase involved in cell wall biosynthesis [Rhodopseudomonas julia]
MRVATILKGYPRLSETFIAQEIRGLEQRGIAQRIVSLRHPTDPYEHDVHREIDAERYYLPEYLKDDPPRVSRARRNVERLPGFEVAKAAFTRDFARDPTANRQRRFGQAAVLAAEMPEDIGWMHCHFLHTPASVVHYASLMTGIGWSFSAHAKDIWTTPPQELTDKLASAAWGVTCTRTNLDYLQSLTGDPDKIELVYHGLDFSRFPKEPRPERSEDSPFTLITVGRAVEKKGFDDLLTALARLPDEARWRLVHIGGGALISSLKAQAERLRLSERIEFRGPQPRTAVLATLEEADLFVLPSRVTADGDRDGLPNVLLEAAAFALPMIATRVSAIPEFIEDGVSGRLVEQRDTEALAAAIATLMGDRNLRRHLGLAAFRRAHADFKAAPGIDRVAAMLRCSLAGDQPIRERCAASVG